MVNVPWCHECDQPDGLCKCPAHVADDLPKRLRLAADGIDPEVSTDQLMTYEFREQQKLMREAADEIEAGLKSGRYKATVTGKMTV